jgi:hypothetical protein
MQEHSINKKRRILALRFFTYGMMTLATAVISVFCILLVLGYRFDFTKHTVSQGGLIQLQSFPNGAKVTLDKVLLSFVSPGKRNVDAGKHTVVFQLDGYREWSKTATIHAGELRWLNYARLIPQTITTSTTQEFTAVTGDIASPDRKWMAIYGAADKAEFTIADLRDSKNVKMQTITLPAGSYTNIAGQAHNFSLVEWDFSGRYLLVRHTIADKVEYLRIDRTNPTDVKNISTQLNVVLSDVHFSGTSGNVFYGMQDASIRKLDIGAGTISEPVAVGVKSFTLYKTNSLAYVLDKGDKRSVSVTIDGESAEVRSYDVTEPVLTDVTSYFSHNYVAIARGTRVDVVKDPIGTTTDARKTAATFQVPVGARWLQFSNNGRFVVAGSGTQFVTYDLETNEQFSANLPGNAADPAKPLQWLDDYYLVSTPDKNLRLSEFDGANQNVITDVEPGLPVTLSEDGKALFSIARTTRGYVLQSSKMVVGN